MNNKVLHDAFVVGIVFKGIDAVLEILGGISLLLIPPQVLNNWLWSLIRHELSEDPGDFIAGHLARLAVDWSVSSNLFVALYLLSHGVVKLLVVAFLLKRKIWAYHTAILFFFLFILYQLYRYSYTHSIWLLVLSGLDVIVIYLTWVEYKRVKATGVFGA